jgi:RluA family pseudouridine synthase
MQNSPVSLPIKLSSRATREFWEIPVLFEDEHLFALDKPPMLSCSPSPSERHLASLMPLLHEGIAAGKPWAKARNLSYLVPAHRMDREASGVLLMARSKQVLSALVNLLNSELPVRSFLALVAGTPPSDAFEINAPIARHPLHSNRMCIDPELGKRSRTRFEVVERFSRHALIRCWPLTDRPHQVRLHLRKAGLRVAGDRLYEGHPIWLSKLKPDYTPKRDQDERPLVGEAALHLETFEFNHPVTGAATKITAPWPKDISVAVKYLRIFAPA